MKMESINNQKFFKTPKKSENKNFTQFEGKK
jgi:hypothetical protein